MIYGLGSVNWKEEWLAEHPKARRAAPPFSMPGTPYEVKGFYVSVWRGQLFIRGPRGTRKWQLRALTDSLLKWHFLTNDLPVAPLVRRTYKDRRFNYLRYYTQKPDIPAPIVLDYYYTQGCRVFIPWADSRETALAALRWITEFMGINWDYYRPTLAWFGYVRCREDRLQTFKKNVYIDQVAAHAAAIKQGKGSAFLADIYKRIKEGIHVKGQKVNRWV